MTLNGLKLLDSVSKTPASVAVKRRDKLLKVIARNIAAIETTPLRLPVRQRWIFPQSDGTYQLAVMYGRQPIELAKGKTGIHCTDLQQVASALALVKDAIESGKLDSEIDGAATTIRNCFKKGT